MAEHLAIGKQAEQVALLYLQRHGLKLIEQNWSCKMGEIDLIMQQQNTLIFIEVRYRKQTNWGSASESVTSSKRKKITASSLLFLQKKTQWAKMACRFDVISITGDIQNPNIEWLIDAFSAF